MHETKFFTLRIAAFSSYPDAAEAKLAPIRRFFPDACGLRYAGAYVLKPRVSAAKSKFRVRIKLLYIYIYIYETIIDSS
jgi:hypothetical protein